MVEVKRRNEVCWREKVEKVQVDLQLGAGMTIDNFRHGFVILLDVCFV